MNATTERCELGRSAAADLAALPPSLVDQIRAVLPVSQVVARKVALQPAGRELKGLSPFKQERTPSFFVNDRSGTWRDFSSGQHGDIFKFVMLTEGLSFPEAVARLAKEADLPVPFEQRLNEPHRVASTDAENAQRRRLHDDAECVLGIERGRLTQ